MAESGAPPAVAGYHHFAPTVSDMEASARWYERVFGMTRPDDREPARYG